MSSPPRSPLPEDLRRSLRDEPPERRRQLEQVWHLLEEIGDERAVNTSTDDAWTSLARSVHAPRADRRPRRRRSMRAAFAVAAAVALLVGAVWVLRPVTRTAGLGEQLTVPLPDGTLVELNSATSLRYERGRMVMGAARTVDLDGEAYFRVRASDRPFVVRTGDARIEVLGTEFNVLARRGPHHDGTVVTVASGRVRLSVPAQPAQGLTLDSTGAVGLVTAQRRAVPAAAPAALDHVLAWRSNGFAVVDRPLDAVFDEMERRFAVEILPREGVHLAGSMSLFYPRGATAEQILRDICLEQVCSFRETSRGYALAARDSTAAVFASPSSVD